MHESLTIFYGVFSNNYCHFYEFSQIIIAGFSNNFVRSTLDLGGGQISSVQFDTKDSFEKQSSEIKVRVPAERPLSQFLTDLRGTRITVNIGGEKISGQILGVESIPETQNNQTVKTGFRLILLMDQKLIRSLDLLKVQDFALEDSSIQSDLSRFLNLSLTEKSSQRRVLRLRATGKGEREIRVGYMVEMPIWKSSYRIILGNDEKGITAFLQGWAIAENTTEEDWQDIEISFISGNPLSYLMDLYSPFYIHRPEVPIPGLDRLKANWENAPSSREDIMKKMANLEKAMERSFGNNLVTKSDAQSLEKLTVEFADELALVGTKVTAMEDLLGGSPGSSGDIASRLSKTFGGAAKGKQVGELFSYQPKEKISIDRNCSAMVPIISQKVNGKKILYFKPSFSKMAANAFVLFNDINLTLDAGAVHVFEGETALGESILPETLPPGGKGILPYAIDSTFEIFPENEDISEPAFRGVLANGVLTISNFEIKKTNWKLANNGKESVTLWLDLPKHPGFLLEKPEKPLEELSDCYRFEIEMKPKEFKDFAFVQKREVKNSVTLMNCDEKTIGLYVSQNYFSEETKGFLRQIFELFQKRTTIKNSVKDCELNINRNSEEQTRIRKNLEALASDQPKEAELRAKWLDSLSLTDLPPGLIPSGFVPR